MIRYCAYFRQTGLKILMALLLTVAYPAPDVAALTATIDVSTVSELRQAIDIANASTDFSEYIIRLAPGTYALAGTPDDDQNAIGDLDIYPSGTVVELTLEGIDTGGVVIIDGGNTVRIIEVFPPANAALTVNIVNLTIQNGYAASFGGGIFIHPADAGAPIQVNLDGVNISNNSAMESGGGLSAGLNNMLDIDNCLLSANSTNFNGGGLYCFGCSANLADTVFLNNVASPPHTGIGGGAIFNAGGVILIDNFSSIEDNDTVASGMYGGYGGALANTGTGSMTVNAPISHSSNSGSGIFNQDGTLTVNIEDRNPTLPGDLVVISGEVTFDIQGRLTVSGTIYHTGGDLIINRELAMPWLQLLLQQRQMRQCGRIVTVGIGFSRIDSAVFISILYRCRQHGAGRRRGYRNPDHFRNAGAGCAFTLPNNAFPADFAGPVDKAYLSEITLLLYICLIIGQTWNILDEHSAPKLQL